MTETAIKTDQKQALNHPLKGKSYFAIARTLAMRTDISDALYRLLTILYGSFGDDGILIFKIKTLCMLMGGKKERAVRGIIKQGRDSGFFTTRQTGRGIEFFIDDRQDSATLVGKNLPISYKQQKRSSKKTTTATEAAKSPPEKPPSPVPKSDLVVVSSLKPLLRPDLRLQFGKKACKDLDDLGLTIGQIKFLIDEINKKPEIKSIGWMLNRAKGTDNKSSIPDLDQLEAQRQKEAEQEKVKAISQAQQWQQWEKEAASKDEAFEIKLKSRGQWERHLESEAERKAAEKERRERTVSKPFSEIKPLFLEYAGELAGDEIKNAFQKMTDDQIRNRIEFKNYCTTSFVEELI